MTIQTLQNMTGLAGIVARYADNDNDSYDRATQLAALAQYLDAHDHSSGKGALINTAGLASHAVTQMASSIAASSQQTTSNSLAAMANFSVTLTTTGGDVLVLASVALQNSVSGYLTSYGLLQDGSGEYLGRLIFPTAGFTQQLALAYVFAGPAAGSHTYTFGWATSSGTLSTDPNVYHTLVALELKR